MAVARFTPEEILRSIRYDPLTKKGSVYDVVQLVTGCDKFHTSETFAGIVAKFPEVDEKVVNLKFPGRGQRPTPVAYLKDLVEIAWLCPGKHAKEFRRTGAVTLCRALGGDLSLVDEIRERHSTVTAEDQEALLAGTGVTAAEANGQALVVSAEDRRALKLRNDREALEIVEKAGEMSKRIKLWAEEERDVRHRLFLEDTARNMFIRYAGLVTGVETETVEVRMPVTISGVAADMGHKKLDTGTLAAIGKKAARLYREQHGEAPPKHVQYVDGAARHVNSYTTEDLDVLKNAVQHVLGQ